jgi:hypothetical protein
MMIRNWRSVLLTASLAMACWYVRADEPSQHHQLNQVDAPATVAEASARARLLHETIRGTLQVIHRDFFDDDDPHAIPSASLEDVFNELSRSYSVDLKWLNVHTDMLNVDHQPDGEFEKKAAKAIKQGKPRYELSADGRYRYAGRIRLASQCLKCHVKNRITTEDRSAGLVISMQLSRSTKSLDGDASTR